MRKRYRCSQQSPRHQSPNQSEHAPAKPLHVLGCDPIRELLRRECRVSAKRDGAGKLTADLVTGKAPVVDPEPGSPH